MMTGSNYCRLTHFSFFFRLDTLLQCDDAYSVYVLVMRRMKVSAFDYHANLNDLNSLTVSIIKTRAAIKIHNNNNKRQSMSKYIRVVQFSNR